LGKNIKIAMYERGKIKGNRKDKTNRKVKRVKLIQKRKNRDKTGAYRVDIGMNGDRKIFFEVKGDTALRSKYRPLVIVFSGAYISSITQSPSPPLRL
jgi:hypothetical protein